MTVTQTEGGNPTGSLNCEVGSHRSAWASDHAATDIRSYSTSIMVVAVGSPRARQEAHRSSLRYQVRVVVFMRLEVELSHRWLRYRVESSVYHVKAKSRRRARREIALLPCNA